MLNNQKGSAFLLLLLLSSLMLIGIAGSLPLFTSGSRMVANFEGSMQARNNAEAGIWLAIAEYKKDAAISSTSFTLERGSVRISFHETAGSLLQIRAEGLAPPHFISVLEVTYDIQSDKIIHWHGVG